MLQRGTVIDDTFVSNLRKACICNLLFSGALYLFLFLLGAIAALFIGQVLRKGAKTLIITAILIVVGVAFAGASSWGAIPAIYSSPEVETVTVINKESHYGGGKVKHWHYTLLFSNGSKHSCSEDEYLTAANGDEYYAVMCGSKNIGAYSTASYSR